MKHRHTILGTLANKVLFQAYLVEDVAIWNQKCDR